jgi:hypothetical protein
MKQIAFQVRRAPPSLHDMTIDVILTFFSQASLLAAPYIVWRSGFGRHDGYRESARPATAGLR